MLCCLEGNVVIGCIISSDENVNVQKIFKF